MRILDVFFFSQHFASHQNYFTNLILTLNFAEFNESNFIISIKNWFLKYFVTSLWSHKHTKQFLLFLNNLKTLLLNFTELKIERWRDCEKKKRQEFASVSKSRNLRLITWCLAYLFLSLNTTSSYQIISGLVVFIPFSLESGWVSFSSPLVQKTDRALSCATGRTSGKQLPILISRVNPEPDLRSFLTQPPVSSSTTPSFLQATSSFLFFLF